MHHPALFSLMEKDLLEIHFVREGYGINKDSNSMRKLMFNMGMVQSHVEQLKDNIKCSLKHKLDTGHWTAKAPVGCCGRRVRKATVKTAAVVR